MGTTVISDGYNKAKEAVKAFAGAFQPQYNFAFVS